MLVLVEFWYGCKMLCIFFSCRCYASRKILLHSIVAHLLRCLAFICSRFQIQIFAAHFPGVHKTIADALSRNNLILFHSLLLQASGMATFISSSLIQLRTTSEENRLDLEVLDFPCETTTQLTRNISFFLQSTSISFNWSSFSWDSLISPSIESVLFPRIPGMSQTQQTCCGNPASSHNLCIIVVFSRHLSVPYCQEIIYTVDRPWCPMFHHYL